MKLNDALSYTGFIKQILRLIHSKAEYLNITDFITVILSLVKIKMLGIDCDKTI